MRFKDFLSAGPATELKRKHIKAKLELKRYRATSGEAQPRSNNSGQPPVHGVSNARYFQ